MELKVCTINVYYISQSQAYYIFSTLVSTIYHTFSIFGSDEDNTPYRRNIVVVVIKGPCKRMTFDIADCFSSYSTRDLNPCCDISLFGNCFNPFVSSITTCCTTAVPFF